MSRDLEMAGIECVQEMASALLAAAGQTMSRHGNDPDSRAILAAGFVAAIYVIGKNIDPRMPAVVCEMLQSERTS